VSSDAQIFACASSAMSTSSHSAKLTTGTTPVVGNAKLDLLGHNKSIIYLNPEIPNGALQFCLAKRS
jgi:hypothetical protein